MGKAFLFGAFNPVTNAHIEMGITARDILGPGYDIIYVPANDAYIRGWKGYKTGSILPGKLRASLLYGAVSQYGFKVMDVEVCGFTDGRTYNTIKYFGFGDSVICLGMDNVIELPKWYKWEELLQNCQLLLFERAGCPDKHDAAIKDILSHSCGYKIAALHAVRPGISSTKVRDCYKNEDLAGLKALVPANVYHYLEENNHVYF